MTSLEQRPSLEDRISAATKAAASTVPDDGAPPLRLQAMRRTRRLPAAVRPVWTGPRGWPGRPWLSQLAAPLAATAAVIAVIAISVAVTDRSHPEGTSAPGLFGAPHYYLELVSDDTAAASANVSATSTGPGTLASSPATGGLDSPSATAPATASSPAANGPLVSPTTTAPLVSPTATGPATTVSPGPNGQATTVKLRTTPLGAILGQLAVIRDTATGATLATIRPLRPFDTFETATAAADDRTFVLAEQDITKSSLGSCGPARLYRASFNPANRRATLTALAIPEIPATSELDAIALSPDGTKLAVAVEPGQSCSSSGSVPRSSPGAAAGREQVSVYWLTSGTVKTWQSTPAWSDGGQVGQNAMSWATDGTLAFNYPGSGGDQPGLYLLNTNYASGDLLQASQLGVSTSAPVQLQRSHGTTTVQPGQWTWSGDGVLTPDGQTVLAPVQRTLQQAGGTGAGAAFAKFSAVTGGLVQVLWPAESLQPLGLGLYYSVIWTNSSGSVLVVAGPTTRGKTGVHSVYGVLRGHRFTPIPGAPSPSALTLFGNTVIVF